MGSCSYRGKRANEGQGETCGRGRHSESDARWPVRGEYPENPDFRPFLHPVC